MNSKKLHLVSLGCTKNLVDSEVMLGRLKEYEITDDNADADVNAATLSIAQTSGYATTGTMTICSPGSGDGCGGGAANITGIGTLYS